MKLYVPPPVKTGFDIVDWGLLALCGAMLLRAWWLVSRQRAERARLGAACVGYETGCGCMGCETRQKGEM